MEEDCQPSCQELIEGEIFLLLHSIYHLGGLLMKISHNIALGRNRSGQDLRSRRR